MKSFISCLILFKYLCHLTYRVKTVTLIYGILVVCFEFIKSNYLFKIDINIAITLLVIPLCVGFQSRAEEAV